MVIFLIILAETMMGLQIELEEAVKAISQVSSSLSLKSGCELFQRYVTRTYLDIPVSIWYYIRISVIYTMVQIRVLWHLDIDKNSVFLLMIFHLWQVFPNLEHTIRTSSNASKNWLIEENNLQRKHRRVECASVHWARLLFRTAWYGSLKRAFLIRKFTWKATAKFIGWFQLIDFFTVIFHVHIWQWLIKAIFR